MPAAAIAREIGVSKKTVLNAKNALNNKPSPVRKPRQQKMPVVEPPPPPTEAPQEAVPKRVTYLDPVPRVGGRFLPGPRYTAEMARVEQAVLANPEMPGQALADKLGVGKTTVLRARKRLERLGPRSAKTARVKQAVLANPSLSARALAKKLSVDKATVLHARQKLKSSGENPVSEVSVEGEAVPQR